MTRWLLLLLLTALLSGCTLLLPEQKELPPQAPVTDRQDFNELLDAFLATGDPAVLDQYLADYPHGVHRDRVQSLIAFARQLQQCRNENVHLVASARSGRKTIAELEEKNRLLSETIEQLKSLLIQLEQRPQ
ncbi:MAG: hypothetical protein R6V33_04910 [Pelovirga sp.]